MEQLFIDRFTMPETAKAEFMERMAINRNMLKTLPGFVSDAAYARTDDEGNFLCLTIAVWADEDALKSAKAHVQAAYRQQGFDLLAMLERLNIRMERGLYQEIKNFVEL